MTKDEIMASARRVGFPMQNPDWQKAVEEFAALCCESEREECARVCDKVGQRLSHGAGYACKIAAEEIRNSA